MAEVVVFPIEPNTARVRHVARWLSGHAGRSSKVFAQNFNMEVRRYAAGLIAAGVPTALAWQHADQFQNDVAARLTELRRAARTLPQADLVLLPIIPLRRAGAAA